MRPWIIGAAIAASLGAGGVALSQPDVIAERRAAMGAMGQQMRPLSAAVQAGDARALLPRIEEMIGFMRTIPDRFPAATLTPPVPQGRGQGQTRAGAAIDANRADFAQRSDAALTAWTGMRDAIQAGRATPDMLRATIGSCDSCHDRYWVR
jgi:cytochrome c556